MGKTTVVAVLFSTVAAASLTACGGAGSTATTTQNSTSTAASGSTTSSSAGSSTTASSAAPSAGQVIEARAFTGPIRTAVKAAGSYHLTERRSTEPAPSTGRISGTGADATFEAEMPGQGTVRLVNGDAYLLSPDTGSKWLKFAKNSTDPEVKAMLTSLTDSVGDSGDLDIWDAGKVTFVAEESGGKHYKVVAPAERFYDETIDEESTTEAGGPVNTSADKAKLAGKSVTYDVWLDSSNRPAKIKFDSTSLTGIKFSAMVDDVVYRSTTTFSKWGEPVTVELPPAAQTVDAEKFMGPDSGTGVA